MKYYVYQLRVQGSSLPFYIGKGKDGRMNSHFSDSSLSKRSLKNAFIKRARMQGLEVYSEILCAGLTESDAYELEEMYVWLYGRIDKKTGILCNHCDGGAGSPGTWVSEKKGKPRKKRGCQTDEVKGKISAAKAGMKFTDDHKMMLRVSKWSANPVVWKDAERIYGLYANHSPVNSSQLGKLAGLTQRQSNGIFNQFSKGWVPSDCEHWLQWSATQQPKENPHTAGFVAI